MADGNSGAVGAVGGDASGQSASNSQATQNVQTNDNSQQSTATENQQQTQNTQQNDANQKDDLGEFADMYNTDKEQQQNNVPESYTFSDADGNDLQLDPEDAKAFSDVFKDAGLTQEQANKLFNVYMSDIKQLTEQIESERNTQTLEQKKSWMNEVKNDSEIGGQNFETTKANIKAVMNAYGSKELSSYLNESGLAYNPHFVRFISRIGASLGNDSNFINGKGSSQQMGESRSERLRRMYPNSPDLV